MVTDEGIVFDLLSIIPWIKKHGTNPVSGLPLTTKGLTRIHFHKPPQSEIETEFHCPITFKIFNDHTHIVVIKTSGNVYSYDAVE